ncbi:MAG: oligosaccharide flippase family protein, partial [Bacteroidales bacterium]|nr:oligosaccharide flippase family protein [Bacteroidales bacterium]
MRHSIAENISINFFIRATTYLFSFLTMMYVTRVLQPATFGITAFASSVAGYFVMLASMGMPLYATRECANSRSSRSELSKTFNELWSINILLAALSLAAFAILVVSVPKLRENSLM